MMSWSSLRRRSITATALLALVSAAHAQTPPITPDTPPKYEAPTSSYDYVKRVAMIPMRDGVKLSAGGAIA